MIQIKRKELRSIVVEQLEKDMNGNTDNQFITHLNGITIYFSDYRITDFEDGNFHITFDGYEEVCSCLFSSTLLDYILVGGYTLYQIID